jgi:hypothetical protein
MWKTKNFAMEELEQEKAPRYQGFKEEVFVQDQYNEDLASDFNDHVRSRKAPCNVEIVGGLAVGK